MSSTSEASIRTTVPLSVARVIVLAMLAATLVAVPVVPAQASAVDRSPPATITICRSSGAVETVPFKQYVKTVLPREFPTDWPMQTIKAGAVAVKSYAWYHVEHPYRPGTCHITDSTRHQKYDPSDPYNRPTAKTDQAVEETWHWRLEENGAVAYAQYCNCSWFPEGRHIQQTEAQRLAAEGLDHVAILAHAYRNFSNYRLWDWRTGFGVGIAGPQPLAVEADAPPTIVARVDGVAAGDARAPLTLYAICTIDGSFGLHEVQTVTATERDGAVAGVFDATQRLEACAQEQFSVRVQLHVNTYPVTSSDAAAWKPWTSESTREVERIAASNDAVAAAIALSQRLFDERQQPAAAGTGEDPLGAATAQQPADGPDPQRQARAIVLARADAFPDSLAATPLAGTDAPVLLNPGGEGATLREDVRAEIDRVLEPGDAVDVVGGPAALPEAIADELREAGYEVRRHGGLTRVETSLAVADAVRERGGDTSTVLLARAWGPGSAAWADAVAAGSYAAAMRHPILLTSDQGLMDQVEAWVEQPGNGVGEAVILGGTAAIPSDAEERLDVATVRVDGQTRSFTAVAIAEELWTRPDAPPISGAMLVDGYDGGDWPFALAASVYAARHGTPQLLTWRLVPNSSTGVWLDGQPELPVTVVGGEQVVPPRIESDAAGPGA